MDQQKGLNALSYLSYFFAPFIVPIIIYFVSKDTVVKYHAKRSFISHIIPAILGVISIIILLFAGLENNDSLSIIFISIFGLTAALSLFIGIWNLVQGIKVLR